MMLLKDAVRFLDECGLHQVAEATIRCVNEARKVEALEAERDRLREALERIERMNEETPTPDINLYTCKIIAREALREAAGMRG